MFTGIVQHVGTVTARSEVPFGVTLEIDLAGWSYRPSPGASLAVDGCCLTATIPEAGAGADVVRFDVIRQTLDNTTLGSRMVGDAVNLEPALAATDRLDGHLVQGHVDGTGSVTAVDRDESEWRLRIAPPAALLDYVIPRGSITVDGVSLTVASVDDRSFEVALIPTTLEHTTLSRRQVDDRVNIETDCVARIVVHWLRRQTRPS